MVELTETTIPPRDRKVGARGRARKQLFTLGFGAALTAAFGDDALQRGVEIGRLVNIAADLKSLVSRGPAIDRVLNAVGLVNGLLEFDRRCDSSER